MSTLNFAVFSVLAVCGVESFAPVSTWCPHSTNNGLSSTTVQAKPQRLANNVEGVVYVNDKCINCSTCSGFAPDTFERQDGYHVVHRQPETDEEIERTRAALSACPVAAIRLDSLAERRHGAVDKAAAEESWTENDERLKQQISSRDAEKPFPRPLLDIDNAYWTGHHNSASFGAVPYLVQAQVGSTRQWIMVDTPRFSKISREEVISITGNKGPAYLFLTHVDDTADHGKWAAEFPGLKRVFHSGDLGPHNWIGDTTLEKVEILLQPHQEKSTEASSLSLFTINGESLESADATEDEVVILHTPGHSPGSITLYHKTKKMIFTGDTYAHSATTKTMSGFPRYGNNLRIQADTLKELLKIDWDVVAPGHGHVRDYRGIDDPDIRRSEMQDALDELNSY